MKDDKDPKMTAAGLNKLRSDATWAALTPEQRETLEGWLFDENIGYAEALERAEKEFGIKGSVMSLVRFYRRTAIERNQRELETLRPALDGIHDAKTGWYEVGGAAMLLVAKRMLLLSMESPEKVKELTALGRVLVANEAQNIRRGWYEIAREKFEFDAATDCLIHKFKMDEIAEDESLDDGERIQKVREMLFGTNLPEAEGEKSKPNEAEITPNNG